jgi:hypothetical protein
MEPLAFRYSACSVLLSSLSFGVIVLFSFFFFNLDHLHCGCDYLYVFILIFPTATRLIGSRAAN